MKKSIFVNIISNKKLICCSNLFMLFSFGNRIYIKRNGEHTYKLIGKIPVSRKYKFLTNIRLMQRMLRLEPRCGIFIDDYVALVSMHGSIFRISALDFSIVREHDFRNGMNNPLIICKVENLDGFESGIYYGEYFGNRDKKEVGIYHRNKKGKWKKVYAFKPGLITHIHRIFVHQYRQSIFVLTGDADEESAIWECKNYFKTVEKIVGGKQSYRSCVAFPTHNGIVYATDTPLEQNTIYQLIIHKEKVIRHKLLDINGPCIYGTCDNEGNMFFSTSVEPDSRIKPYIRYMFSYRLGPALKNRYSYVYGGNISEGIYSICKEKKDLFPMLLLGFGTFLFPECNGKKIYLVGQGLKKIDGKTLIVRRKEKTNESIYNRNCGIFRKSYCRCYD